MDKYSGIDYIITLLVEEIESYFKNREKDDDDGYQLNQHTNVEIEQIQMIIYIHKKRENNKYSYDLSAKNFYYINEIHDKEEIDFFKSSEFDTIFDLFENLTYVKQNYVVYDKKLCSPKQKKKLQKLKRSLSFFSKENEHECSICYEPTNQVTICSHPICLHCRDKCILFQKNKCPICRFPNLNIYPYPPQLFTL
jgi:hypothetical protein